MGVIFHWSYARIVCMCVKILKLGSLRKLEDGGASVEEERGRVKVAQRCMTKANYL